MRRLQFPLPRDRLARVRKYVVVLNTPLRRAFLLVVLVALALGVLARTPIPTASAIGYSPVLDAPSDYDGQTTCTKSPRPGTIALAHYLLSTYKATRSLGMMRPCHVGGQSEHKDGRAFDWGADVAKPATRRAAYDFIGKLLAPDAAGDRGALARRMGIMYFIYNDRIWSSYRDFQPRPYLNSGCKSLKKCSRTLRHKNHVHISLGLAGAAAQTSWYRARNVPSQPVLYPGTNLLDPDLTAVTGFSVPATGALTSSPFVLEAGVTYRVVATGTVGYGEGTGDAACTEPTGTTEWQPNPFPLLPERGLLIGGTLGWVGGCTADHTYETWFTPLVNQRLQAKYLDVPAAGNTGAFTVYVARDDITLGSLARALTK